MSHVVERPSGVGTLSEDGKNLGQVEYNIIVYQETRRIDTQEGSQELEGRRRIEGEITPRENQDLWDLCNRRAILVLELKDGRILECSLAPGGEIVNRSGKGIHRP